MKIIKYAFYDEEGNFIAIIKEAFKNNVEITKKLKQKYDRVYFDEDQIIKHLPSFYIHLL